MTAEQFQPHMNRLITQFGKTAYSTERCALFWREVRDFDSAWWEKLVDRFIGEHRQPPLLPELREAVAQERERRWRIEKDQHAREAQGFFQGTYAPDDCRTICQVIIKRISGGVSDAEYADFVKHLKHAAGERESA